jgi:hypothetical protein
LNENGHSVYLDERKRNQVVSRMKEAAPDGARIRSRSRPVAVTGGKIIFRNIIVMSAMVVNL